MGYEVKEKVALVTGANRGIGLEIVETFMRNGAAKVYAAVRAPASAKTLVEAYGGRVEVIQVDLEHPESILAAARWPTMCKSWSTMPVSCVLLRLSTSMRSRRLSLSSRSTPSG